MNVQMTLEQNCFEQHGSTYMWIFFNKCTGKNFGDFQQFKKICKKKKKFADEILKKFKKKDLL